MKKFISLAVVLCMVLIMAVPAMAYGNADASASAVIVGNNWNQGHLSITVTDNHVTVEDEEGNSWTAVVENNPGNGTHNVNVGPYTVSYRVQGNNVLDVRVSGHHECVYVAVVTAPTCDEDGFTTFTCYICDKYCVANEVDALGCDWDEGRITKEAYRTEAGEITYTCERCGDTKTEETFFTGSTTVTVAPTCTLSGFTGTHIYVDGVLVWAGNFVYTDALGHNFQSVVWDGHGWWHSGCTECYWEGYYCSDDSCICVAPTLVSVSGARLISVSNSNRITTIVYEVTKTFSDETTVTETFTSTVAANNSNVDGRIVFGDDHDLAGMTLTYDIKGNGSNVKTFNIK